MNGDLGRELYLMSCLHSVFQGGAFGRGYISCILIRPCSIKELIFIYLSFTTFVSSLTMQIAHA